MAGEATVDLVPMVERLASQRPVFHSEADFQHALAWEIHNAYPNVAVRLESRPLSSERLYLDLWVAASGSGPVAIELKYMTKGLSVDVSGERFDLANHAAHLVRRYDFIKDIARLELIASRVPGVTGAAILLTNESAYWTDPARPDVADAAFRIHEGAHIGRGPLAWSPAAGRGTTAGREAPLVLQNDYDLHWRDFSVVTQRAGGTFRYLVVNVNGQLGSAWSSAPTGGA